MRLFKILGLMLALLICPVQGQVFNQGPQDVSGYLNNINQLIVKLNQNNGTTIPLMRLSSGAGNMQETLNRTIQAINVANGTTIPYFTGPQDASNFLSLLNTLNILAAVGGGSLSITQTGGTVTTVGANTIITWLSSGSISSNIPFSANALVVGGGAGGGGEGGGGGAGGGVVIVSFPTAGTTIATNNPSAFLLNTSLPIKTISPSNKAVVLSPTLTFQFAGSPRGAVQEPSIWKDSAGLWNMLYTGGYSTSYTGWAISTSPNGPWTDQGQVLGGGDGGESGQADRNSVYYDSTLPSGQRLTIFYSTAGTSIKIAQGDTPAVLSVVGTALASVTGATTLENTSVIKDGSTYVMMIEGTDSGLYRTGYATSSTLTGTYAVQTFPLPTLQVGGGMYGGPNLFKVGSTYILYYQDGDTGGNLPTNIYRATSTDLVNWTPSSAPIISRTIPLEVDQVADPYLYQDTNGQIHFWWSAGDNTNGDPHFVIVYANPELWN